MESLPKLFDKYVDELCYSACLRPETIRGYRNVFELFLRLMPEVTTLKDLTPEMLNEFFKRIQTRQRKVGKETIKTGVKKSTIKTQWSKLNVFFVWLEKEGLIAINPLNNIKPPKVTYDDFKRLKDDEVNKIYATISMHSSSPFILRRDTLMVSLLL